MANLERLSESDQLHRRVVRRMRETIMDHDNGIPLKDFRILQVYKILNSSLKDRFERKKSEIEREMGSECPVWEGFHGSPNALTIASEGFDVGLCKRGRMFGKGVYLAPQSSKANQYTFGKNQGCPDHGQKACTLCTRRMLFCLCAMGRQFRPHGSMQDVPSGHHSVFADPANDSRLAAHLKYPEISALHGDQVLPYVLVEYQISSEVLSTPELPRLTLDASVLQMTDVEDLLSMLVLQIFAPILLLMGVPVRTRNGSENNPECSIL